jgi:GT2 family glycosyltransferase
MSVPFTAARARNAGFRRLQQIAPACELVQFVDGDCEVVDGWLASAASFLAEHADVACVCGRLRERDPGRSVFNRLCDLEWNRPVGETDACGGIAMMRCAVFAAVGGFRDGLIAGEEPELCLRIRLHGARVWRIGHEMAWHDAAMTRFSQWWRRAMRGGYAAAEGVLTHPGEAGGRYRRHLAKIALWALAMPAMLLVLGAIDLRALALALVYPLQIARLAQRTGWTDSTSWIAAAFTVLANFPEAMGAGKYAADRLRGGRAKVIEYR